MGKIQTNGSKFCYNSYSCGRSPQQVAMGFNTATGDGSRQLPYNCALDLFHLQEDMKPGDSRYYQIDLNHCHGFFHVLFEKLLIKTVCSLFPQKQIGRIRKHEKIPATGHGKV